MPLTKLLSSVNIGKKDLEAIGAQNVSVLYWGYDPDDFKNIEPKIDQKFTISHLGILSHDRNPQTFLNVIKELIDDLPGFKNDFEIKLVGQVDFTIKELYENLGIEKNINYLGSVKRQEALQLTCNSNVLLLLLNQQENAKGRVPGKFFEYLASKRPILGLGTTEGDIANLTNETKCGIVLEYDDHQQIKSKILRILQFI